MLPEARPRIALIHALSDSVAPCHAAFGRIWPEAHRFDLLDTSLSQGRAAIGRLDASILRRVHSLADYAETSSGEAGATRALLFTCSAFGSRLRNRARCRPMGSKLSNANPNGSIFR